MSDVKVVGVKFPISLAEKLDELAKKFGETPSTMIRHMVMNAYARDAAGLEVQPDKAYDQGARDARKGAQYCIDNDQNFTAGTASDFEAEAKRLEAGGKIVLAPAEWLASIGRGDGIPSVAGRPMAMSRVRPDDRGDAFILFRLRAGMEFEGRIGINRSSISSVGEDFTGKGFVAIENAPWIDPASTHPTVVGLFADGIVRLEDTLSDITDLWTTPCWDTSAAVPIGFTPNGNRTAVRDFVNPTNVLCVCILSNHGVNETAVLSQGRATTPLFVAGDVGDVVERLNKASRGTRTEAPFSPLAQRIPMPEPF